jgi:lipopolysaccharide/colanic/teichoic acid biosynthesis glycosyltransferase
MRAVLIATGEVPEGNTLGHRHLLPMLPLLDRPFVQHLLEFFVGQGVAEFDIVLSHLPEAIERHLRDGTRWGCRLRYHLVRNTACPYGVLSRLGLEPRSGERLLLGHADRLPLVQLAALTENANAPSFLFVSSDCQRQTQMPEGVNEWTGWGLLTARELLGIPRDIRAETLYAHLRAGAGSEVQLSEVTTLLSVRSPAELLASQQLVLEKQVSGLMFSGRERAPGVWIASSAKVSPKAELSAPVYIGPSCTVGTATRLGPHAVVTTGCVIDRRCCIRNSAVLPGSYVGEGMVHDGAVIDGDLAVNACANSITLCADPLTQGTVPRVSLTRAVGAAFPRLFALALLIALVPLLLLAIVWLTLRHGGRALRSRVVVRLPPLRIEGRWATYRLYSFVAAVDGANASQRPPGLGHALLDVLPGLIHIVRGQLHFVGVPPRSPDEVSSLPQEWRDLYLQTKAGVVSVDTFVGAEPRVEDRFAAEAAYAVTRSWHQDLRLLAAYLWQALSRSFGRLSLLPAPRAAKEAIAGTRSPAQPEGQRYRLDEAAPAACNGAGPHSISRGPVSDLHDI